MTKYKILSLVFLSLLIGASVYSIIWHVDNYNKHVYPFNKKLANFDRATATSDLGDAADYCEEVYDYIKQFSGNPNWIWWAKTKRTDWDLIRKDLKSVIDDAREADNNTNPGDDAYQEAIKVIKMKIDPSEEDEEGLKQAIDHNFDLELYQMTWIAFWILMSIWLILFIFVIIFVSIWIYKSDW